MSNINIHLSDNLYLVSLIVSVIQHSTVVYTSYVMINTTVQTIGDTQ